MGRTSIQVSDELADELHGRKDRGDSYEDVIWRLIDGRDSSEQAEAPESAERATTPAAPREPLPSETREQLRDAPDFPGGVDHGDGVEAILAARDYLRKSGPASARQIVLSVGGEFPLKYDIPESLESGERYRGAWWRRVVKPGLQALDDVKAPATGGSEWRYVGGADD